MKNFFLSSGGQSAQSLRRKLLLPWMALAILLLAVALLSAEHFIGKAIAEGELTEARQLASAVSTAHLALTSDAQFERFVASYGALRSVRMIAVAQGPQLRVVAATRQAWIGASLTSLLGDAGMQQLQHSESGGEVFELLQDDSRYLHRYRLNPGSFLGDGASDMAVLMIELSDPEARARQRLWFLWTALVMLATLGVLGTSMFVLQKRHVIAPLERIARALAAAGSGRVPVESTDEIGRTAMALNEALERVDAQKDALRIKDDAMASSISGIAMTDMDGRLTYANPAWLAMHGYDSSDDIVGGTPQRHVQDPAAAEVVIEAIKKDGRWSGEIMCLRRDGSVFPAEMAAGLVRDSGGKPMGMMASFHDITERRRIEEQLRQSQKLEAIGQLTGGLAHDFNNLLGVVVGNLDLLADKLPEDETLRRRHRAALEAALRGAEVTRSLLAVARRQPLKVEVHDLNALLAEMLPLVRSSVGAAVTVRSQLWPGELAARVDAAGLSNALLNLVINARDSMETQSEEQILVLRTRAERIAEGGDGQLTAGTYAVVEVGDSGPGMSEEVRQRAFEPFFTTKEVGKGTGLGLSMVRGFAEQLGGTARIESEPGRGTTVRLYLPLEAERAAALEQAEIERLEALDLARILDTPPEPAFDGLVLQAARLCGAPIALVSLVDEHRQWFKASVGVSVSETPRIDSFCAHAIREPGKPLIVEDASKDARFSASGLVVGEPFIRLYAGVPLVDASGQALGTLCVIDRQARGLSPRQIEGLQALAARASDLLRARLPAPDLRPTREPGANPLPAPHQAPPPTVASRARVLVVDDEPALCELACHWLESLGYRTQAAQSGAQALAAIEQGDHDVLFTDVLMPGGMDGLMLAREATRRWPAISVLLASGYARGLAERSELPWLLLNKPYRKAELERAMLEVCDSAASHGDADA